MRKLKFIILLTIVGIFFSNSIAASQCFGPESSLYDPPYIEYDAEFEAMFPAASIGGVLLDKTLNVLNEIENIKGAAFDPVKGEMVFVGDDHEYVISDPIEMNDLVAAVRSIFLYQQSPGVTFYTKDGAKAVLTGEWDVSYFGGTHNTQFGKLLFEADYVLKQLTLGVGEDKGAPEGGDKYKLLSELHPDFFGATSDSGFKSFAQLLFENDIDLSEITGIDSIQVEFYFAPAQLDLEAYSPNNESRKSFQFTNVKMELRKTVIGKYRLSSGEIVDVEFDIDGTMVNRLTGEMLTQDHNQKALAIQLNEHAAVFANFITDSNNYNQLKAINNEQLDFSVLKQLERLAKITSIVRWIYEEDIPIDLSFLSSYEPEKIETQEKTRILMVCKSNTGDRIVAQGSGEFGEEISRGTCISGKSIIGGISYAKQINTNVLAAEPSFVGSILDHSSRALNATEAEHLRWNDGLGNFAVATTVGTTQKPGNVFLPSVDLAYPNAQGLPVALTRYYDSFSNLPSGFGPGWSELPFEISLPEMRAEFEFCHEWQDPNSKDRSCSDPEGAVTIVGHRELVFIDRVKQRSIKFEGLDYLTWRVPSNGSDVMIHRPIYHSKENNDVIWEIETTGWFRYLKRDWAGNVVQAMWFRDRTYMNPPQFTAKLETIETPSVGANGEDLQYISYDYDEQARLVKIYGNNGVGMDVEYNDKRISKVVYNTADGVRDVGYEYLAGRLERVNKSGRSIGFSYVDDFQSNDFRLSGIFDELREGETILSTGQWDLESRASRVSQFGLDHLASVFDFNRITGTTITTKKDGSNNDVVQETSLDELMRLDEQSHQYHIGGGLVASETVSMEYDENNLLAGPSTVQIDHSTDENTSSSTKTIGYAYDIHGNVNSFTDDLNRTTEYFRGVDSNGFPIHITKDPKGRMSAVRHDPKGRVIASYRRVKNITPVPDMANNDDLTTVYSFEVPEQGYQTTITYDEKTGKAKSVGNTIEDKVVFEQWNEFGFAEKIISPAGYETNRKYDSLARLRSIQSPIDYTPVSYNYVEAGVEQDSLASVEDDIGTLRQELDIKNRRKTVVDSRGVFTNYRYNRRGQIKQIVEVAPDLSKALVTQYFYNDHGELLSKLLPNNARVEYTYNGIGEVTSISEYEDLTASSSPSSPNITTILDAEQELIYRVDEDSNSEPFVASIEATNEDGSLLIFELLQGPSEAEMTENGQMLWIPTLEDAGSNVFTILVSDGNGGVDTLTFVVDVVVNQDSDSDGVFDHIDNCRNHFNANQLDSDGDGRGNIPKAL